uniref:Capsid protein n=1 Tax=Suillus luteus megabirnavirus 1 TaxID=3067809 RepID=A0AA49X7A5_9VIRU|nr:capsid protein [Suillus luteus megabirnavirus 1]
MASTRAPASYNTATAPKVQVTRESFFQNTKSNDYTFRFAKEDDAVEALAAQLEAGVVQHQTGDISYNAGGMASFSTILSGSKRVTHQQVGAFIDQTGHGAEGSLYSTSSVKLYGTGKEVGDAISDVRNLLSGQYERRHAGLQRLGQLASQYTDNAPTGMTMLFNRLIRGAMHTTSFNAHRVAIAGRQGEDPMGYHSSQYYHDSRRIMPHRLDALLPAAANVAVHASLINNAAENHFRDLNVGVTSELNRILLTISEIPSFRASELRNIVAVLDAVTKEHLGFAAHADQMGEQSVYTKGVRRINDILIIDLANFYGRCVTNETAANDNGFQDPNEPAPQLVAPPVGSNIQAGHTLWFGFAGNAANRTGVCDPTSWMNAIAFLLELEGGREACAVAMNDVVEQTTRFFGPNVTHLSAPVAVRANTDVFGAAHKVLRNRLAWMYTRVLRVANNAGNGFMDKQLTQWATHPKVGRRDDRAAAAGDGAGNVNLIDQTLANALLLDVYGAGVAPGDIDDDAFNFIWANANQDGPGRAYLANNSGDVDPMNDQVVRKWGNYNPVAGHHAGANPPALGGAVTIYEIDNFWYHFCLNWDLSSNKTVEDMMALLPSSVVSELLIWLTDIELAGGPGFAARWHIPAAQQNRRTTLPIPDAHAHMRTPAHMRNWAWVNREEVHYASEFVGTINFAAYTGLAAFWNYVKDTRTGQVTEDDKRLAARFRIMRSSKLMSLAFSLGGQMRAAADAMAVELQLSRSTLARMQGHILTDNAQLDAELEGTDIISAQLTMKSYRNQCLDRYDALVTGMGIYSMMATYSKFVECDVRFNGEVWNLRRNRSTAFVAYRCLHPMMFEYFCPGANVGGGMLQGQTMIERVESGNVKAFPALFKPEDDSINDLEIYAGAQAYAAIAGYHIKYAMHTLISRKGDGTGSSFFTLFEDYLRAQMRLSDCGPGSTMLSVSPLLYYAGTFRVDLFEPEGSFQPALVDMAQLTFVSHMRGWMANTCGDSNRPNMFPHGTSRLANSDVGVNKRFAGTWGQHGLNKPTWGLGGVRRRNADDEFDNVDVRMFELRDIAGNMRPEYSVLTNPGFALVRANHTWATNVQSNRGLLFVQSYGETPHDQVDRSAAGFKFARERITFRLAAMSDKYEFTMHPLAKAEVNTGETLEPMADVWVGDGTTNVMVTSQRISGFVGALGGTLRSGPMIPKGVGARRTVEKPVQKPIPGTVEHTTVESVAATTVDRAEEADPAPRVRDPLAEAKN